MSKLERPVRRAGDITSKLETKLKFMTMVRTTKPGLGFPPMGLMEAITQLGQEAMAAGVLVDQGGLLGREQSAFVTVRQGKVMVTDGPFAEAKELVGGYAVYDVPDMAAALVWTEKFAQAHIEHWPEWEGAIDIRPMM